MFSSSNVDITATGVPLRTTGLNPDIYNGIIQTTYPTALLSYGDNFVVTTTKAEGLLTAG